MSENNSRDKKSEPLNKKYIVGIGASAGGLEALQMLLSALPTDLGFPYIVVQHLSPDYKSLLSEILSKNTEMPVLQIEDGMEVKENHVYIIPPRKSMRISEGKLFLDENKSGELHLPIDTFFKSLADEAGDSAIGIILSGTGSDGTNGIKCIKENDGMLLVQSPESSKFDGMPRNAIRTGLVDAECTPEEIADELAHISEATRKGIFPPKTEKEISGELMERVYYIMKKASNVNFTHYKQATILRRIERRMMLARIDNLADYVDYLYEVPGEAKILSKEVLIGVTNFFREPEYFECLKEKAIYPIINRCPKDETIRVWVAGCCTGEEAYSIAILFCEAMEELDVKRDVKIFATDLDAEAVTTAGKGVFGLNIANAVSVERLSHYFTRKGDTYVINRDLRKMLVFSPHNVIQDPPFGRLDLISCRNLLIYFQPVLQKDLFAIFHAALKDEGYLFLGKSEAVGTYTEVFPVVDAMAKIFTHCSNVKIPGAKPIPYLQTALNDEEYDNSIEEPTIGRSGNRKIEEIEKTDINIEILEKFMPTCLIVNEKNELMYVYGESKNYISFPVGKVTKNLFDVINEQMRIPVSTALKEARKTHKMVQYKNIVFTDKDAKNVTGLTATPVSKALVGEDSLYALIFNESNDSKGFDEAIPYEIDHMAAQRIIDLEQELNDVHDQLNRSVTEQECVTEELQASNEELLTANEELQSSNEELQSVNEELYTVNSEYQIKLTELAEVNDDIANFLNTTLIGMIFVDSKLSLRRFTNYVTTEFSVMDQDIGRNIDFISYHFPDIDIAIICRNVIETLMPDEREINTNRDKTYFMRVSPFRTVENKILGCVITFMDTTDQKKERIRLENTEAKLSLAQKASEAKSDFLSRMSHEIRTPMSTIVGLSDLVQTQLDDRDALEKSAKQLSETVKYMTSIVSDILEMSKIEHSQIELVSEPFIMKELLNKIVNMMKPQMDKKKLKFEYSFSDDFLPMYLGDTTRLQQLLVNFLTNAVKFTPAGGTVIFNADEEFVENGMATIRFVISDTGKGIKKEFIPDLFKPFSREGSGNKTSLSSMGLGLSIANSFIQMMDGDVAVESEVGKGSTFVIHIKLTTSTLDREVQLLSDGKAKVKKYELEGCNVLIAEDNAINRTILESLLANQGVTFSAANDGKVAVDTFKSMPAGTFDCVLMDMRMPNIDGVEAAKLIRGAGKEDSDTIPIIAVSANAFSSDMEVAGKAGINDYITKPIETDKLFALLARHYKKSMENKKGKAGKAKDTTVSGTDK